MNDTAFLLCPELEKKNDPPTLLIFRSKGQTDLLFFKSHEYLFHFAATDKNAQSGTNVCRLSWKVMIYEFKKFPQTKTSLGDVAFGLH